MGNYEIKSGDCLWSIIKNHFKNTLSDSEIGEKVKELAKANNISNPNLIKAGEELDLSSFDSDKKKNRSSNLSLTSIWDSINKKSTTNNSDSLSLNSSINLPE